MPFLVFSGLPGSGKSTLAARVAARTGLAAIDKDTFLDHLLTERGSGDAAWRAALSREADEQFAAAAKAARAACLVSWWRHPHASSLSGTSTEWLKTLDAPVVEIHCACDPDAAVDRFLGRRRHPGHLDATKTRQALVAQFREQHRLGPLGIEPGLQVATDREVDLDSLLIALSRLAEWPTP